MAPKAKTEFQSLLDDLVDTERRLRALPPRPKLTASAFVATAMTNAGADCDDERLDAIEALLADPRNGAVSGFCLRLERSVVLDAAYGMPPANGPKLVRAYGSDEALPLLNTLGVHPLEVLALAARRAGIRSPEAFGICESVEELTAIGRGLHDRRASLIEQLRRADLTPHIVIETESVDRRHRDDGLCRIVFRDWPSVALVPDWPEVLIAAVLAPVPQEAPAAA
ncbi:MAG: hypothetical protein AB7G10_24745 [Reyranellaceae bacterium]